MRYTRQQISAFQLAVAHGAKQSDVAREHGFAASNFRRWFQRYGRPHIPYVPTAQDREHLKSWRRESTLEKQWRAYRKLAEQRLWWDDSELPPLDDTHDELYERLKLETRADARIIVVCEKLDSVRVLDEWGGTKDPSVAHDHQLALATLSFLPSRWSCEMISNHAKHVRATVAFLGDLDPQALHAFGALRAGGRENFLKNAKRQRDVQWIGLDSIWLAWLAKTSPMERKRHTMPLTWLDQEYWEVVKRAMPDVKSIIGARAHALLDAGTKLEIEPVLRLREPWRDEMRRRLAKVHPRG